VRHHVRVSTVPVRAAKGQVKLSRIAEFIVPPGHGVSAFVSSHALDVLFPPLALQLAANFPFSVDRGSRLLPAAISLAVALLNFVAKGAAAAFYLRRKEVIPTGSP
jgi:hypothetical protein